MPNGRANRRWQVLFGGSGEFDEDDDFRRRASTVDEGVPFFVARKSCPTLDAAALLPPLESKGDQALGLCLVTIASLIFGTAAMFVKLSPLSGLLIMEVRCSVQWILSIFSIVLWKVINPSAKRTAMDMLFGEPGVRKWILLRSIVHWTFMVSYWLAARLLPFGNCTALVYVGPLFTVIPAYIFLKEDIAPQFLLIAPMTLIGLLMITQPSFIFGTGNEDLNSLGLAFSCCATLSLVVLPVITKCGKDSHWLQIEHGSTFIGAFILTPLAILVERHFDASKGDPVSEILRAWEVLQRDRVSILIVLLIPCAQFVGLAFQTVAYQIAEAGKCSLMLYLMIPQSYVMQYFVFQSPMTIWGNVGVTLIIIACLLNGWITLRGPHCSGEKNGPASNVGMVLIVAACLLNGWVTLRGLSQPPEVSNTKPLSPQHNISHTSGSQRKV
eukprot:EG_transcript_10167